MSNADRLALLALAARVEMFSDPDRETDERIGMAIGLKNTMRVGHELLGNNRVVPVNCPAYTASIDAAKTLVPKGWHVGMLTECDEDDSPSCCLTENEEPCRDAVGRGADMALSLVAASLRARAGGL